MPPVSKIIRRWGQQSLCVQQPPDQAGALCSPNRQIFAVLRRADHPTEGGSLLCEKRFLKIFNAKVSGDQQLHHGYFLPNF